MAFYPFNGDKAEEVIIYEDDYFWVSCGYDKEELCYHIGLMWKPRANEDEKGYPLGQNGQPQWFRLRDELAPSFLNSLLGKQPQNDAKILEAMDKFTQQISIKNDIDVGGAQVPFIPNKDNPKYPFTALYSDTYFLIVKGEDKDFKNRLSIGIRWRKSRNEEPNKSNPLGFPLTHGTVKCWFILPDDIALCILPYVRSKTPSQSCQIDKNEIDKAIQILKAQI